MSNPGREARAEKSRASRAVIITGFGGAREAVWLGRGAKAKEEGGCGVAGRVGRGEGSSGETHWRAAPRGVGVGRAGRLMRVCNVSAK